MGPGGLFGRESESKVLLDLIDALPLRGGALVVRGEPGIGKSALLNVATDHARATGLSVFEAVGVPAEAKMPYAGLHQLLRPALPNRRALATPQRRALAIAFGECDGPAPAPILVGLATLNLLIETAVSRPVVVFADDVQSLDRPTHEVLTFVARRVESDPIAVIGAVRSDYLCPFADAGLTELRLSGLTAEAARDLSRACGGGLQDAVRKRILRVASGNPLAIVELSAAWRAGLSGEVLQRELPLTSRLRRAFAERLEELPAATRDVLLVAAEASVRELPHILAPASVLAGHGVTATDCDAAMAVGLITVEGAEVRFRHPLMRSAIVDAESMARRQAANEAIAATLDDQPYLRAWHRSLSIVGPDDGIADDLETNIAVPLRLGDTHAAIRGLERAAELTTDPRRRARRLLAAAEHASRLGKPDLVEHLLAAASRHPLSAVEQAKAELLHEGHGAGSANDPVRVMRLCALAGEAAGSGDTDLALDLLVAAALRCWWADPGAQVRGHVVSLTDRLACPGGDPRHLAALALAEPILRCAEVMKRLAQIVSVDHFRVDEIRYLALAAHAIGDPERAADYLEVAEARLRGQGRLGGLALVLALQYNVWLDLGLRGRAASAADEGRRIAQETRQPIVTKGTLMGEARAAGLSGDADTALRLATTLEREGERNHLNNLLSGVGLARGTALLGRRRYAEAYAVLRRLFDPADHGFHLRQRFTAITFLAEAAVRADQQDDAQAILSELQDLAAETPSPMLHIHLLHARAVLAGDDAECFYTAALATDLRRWPLIRARIELAYGAWLRRRRRTADSRAPLRSALATFERMQTRPWADQARAELRAAGVREPETAHDARHLLSPQELQVARLAVEGLTNREIGERMYLSPRTVASHLYRIFPKLNVTSRAQLAARLQSED
ncbi:LuxR C-terminal-related transcriptional regulator [Actinoallomurus purpureus]|uniref:helix-turn-helix transcriptional regulator n=1 Tax=Actinoallomurus purpureus TaxID=478114 RepID=UPI002092DA02|nr:LuxR family transcriptional regulator [Actinoallomurus purpureus]MCO6007725.1 LuxR C-terminal-related transcriptional regulator [Actinoallomurus purpureus]